MSITQNTEIGYHIIKHTVGYNQVHLRREILTCGAKFK